MRAIQKIGLCDVRLRLVTRHAVIVERPTMQAWNVVVTECRLQGGDWCANKALCFIESICLKEIKLAVIPSLLKFHAYNAGVPQ